MTDLIPIGRFAQITHLSVKALRMYAKAGLLRPAYVDPESGYRYYRLYQAALAARIRLLRLVEMPLEDIRVVVHASDPVVMQAHLATHQQRLTTRITRDQQSLVLLQRLCDQPDAFLSFEVQLKEVPDQPLLSVSAQAAPGMVGQAIGAAFGTIIPVAVKRGVYVPDAPPLIIVHQDTPEGGHTGGIAFEAGVPITRLIEGRQGIVSTVLPGGMVASVVHVGPYHELELIYPMLGAWIEAHGYRIAGPLRNLLLTNPTQLADPTGYHTEVQWPLSPGEHA
jgi:DNA-binding transcriptional MerR regulator